MLIRPAAYVIAGRLYSWWKAAAARLGGKAEATLVRDIIAARPVDRRQLFALPATASVQDAVRMMLRHRISAVLVLAPQIETNGNVSRLRSTAAPGSEFVPVREVSGASDPSFAASLAAPVGLGAHCGELAPAASPTSPTSQPFTSPEVLGMVTQSDIMKHYGAEAAREGLAHQADDASPAAAAAAGTASLCSSTVVGLVTESDVLRRAVAEDHSPSATPLHRVMTPFADLAYVFPENSVESALQILAAVGAHHLPVMDDFPSGAVEAPGATVANGASGTGNLAVASTAGRRAGEGVRRGGAIRALVSLPELVGLTRGVREARQRAAEALGPITRIGAHAAAGAHASHATGSTAAVLADVAAAESAGSHDGDVESGHELELDVELSEPKTAARDSNGGRQAQPAAAGAVSVPGGHSLGSPA